MNEALKEGPFLNLYEQLPNQQQDGKMRIIQEIVPGKQITIAHIIANPDEILYQKLGLCLLYTSLRPKYAVLDPELTVGLPPHITSTTGMDALTHAVEAYIGHSNTCLLYTSRCV